VNFCKITIDCKFIFHVFYEEILTYKHVVETAQGLNGRVHKMEFVLPIELWVFTFFDFVFCSWFLILFKEFYKFHSVEFKVKATVNKKISSLSTHT
jgi:hypothetical protein